MGTPNRFSHFVLLLFVPSARAAFATMRGPLAAIVIVVFGEMFLPQAVAFDRLVFLGIGKVENHYIGVLAGTLIFTAPNLMGACQRRTDLPRRTRGTAS